MSDLLKEIEEPETDSNERELQGQMLELRTTNLYDLRVLIGTVGALNMIISYVLLLIEINNNGLVGYIYKGNTILLTIIFIRFISMSYIPKTMTTTNAKLIKANILSFKSLFITWLLLQIIILAPMCVLL